MESDLSQPVSDWLIAKGFTPYAEVSFPGGGRRIDLIGRKGTDLIVVELKRGLTQSVIHQTYLCSLISDQRYAAVGTRPSKKGVGICEKIGVGLLSVRGAVDVVLAPRAFGIINPSAECHICGRYRNDCGHLRNDYADRVHKTLDRMTPNGIGGLPTLKGIGPAQECYDRVQLFLTENPKAKYREIYERVPNHYGSAGSMCGAMRTVEETRRKRGLI